jgi:hypothetical protein
VRLEDLSEPDLGGAAEFYSRWLTWERMLEEAERVAGHLFDDCLKVAIVRSRCPSELRTHLELHAAEYEENYDAMRRVVDRFFRARGAVRFQPSSGGVAQVSYLQVKGGRTWWWQKSVHISLGCWRSNSTSSGGAAWQRHESSLRWSRARREGVSLSIGG